MLGHQGLQAEEELAGKAPRNTAISLPRTPKAPRGRGYEVPPPRGPPNTGPPGAGGLSQEHRISISVLTAPPPPF